MHSIQQAKKIYEVCMLNAKAGKKVTYREVLNSLGYSSGVRGYAIKYGLELVWIACAISSLPILTSIVINKDSREPTAKGFQIPDWKEEAQKAFSNKHWPNVDEIDWEYIWQNRKQLSNRYATRGYWER